MWWVIVITIVLITGIHLYRGFKQIEKDWHDHYDLFL